MKCRICAEISDVCQEKFQRLLGFFEGDPDGLVTTAIELLWEQYGEDVIKVERGAVTCQKRIACMKTGLGNRIGSTLGVLIGKRAVNVSESGDIILPKDWYVSWGCPEFLYVVEDKGAGCWCLFDSSVFDHCYKATQKRARVLLVSRQRRLRLDRQMLSKILNCTRQVEMVGALRYVRIYPLSCLKNSM